MEKEKPSKETMERIKKLRGTEAEPVSSGSAEAVKTSAAATPIGAVSQEAEIAQDKPKKQIRTLIMNGKILNNDALDQFIENLVQ